jgi:hypothetical protein
MPRIPYSEDMNYNVRRFLSPVRYALWPFTPLRTSLLQTDELGNWQTLVSRSYVCPNICTELLSLLLLYVNIVLHHNYLKYLSLHNSIFYQATIHF